MNAQYIHRNMKYNHIKDNFRIIMSEHISLQSNLPTYSYEHNNKKKTVRIENVCLWYSFEQYDDPKLKFNKFILSR